MKSTELITNRRSVRQFIDKPIEEETLHRILDAAMSGPCCVNARDWAFIVVTDREKLCAMAEANGAPAAPLKQAAAAILICGDLKKAFPPAPDYWVIDGAIAGQNICLAAYGLGVGSVWLGTWPQMERVTHQRELFNLPEHIVPHSVIALGYPAESITDPRDSRYDPACVHWNGWA